MIDLVEWYENTYKVKIVEYGDLNALEKAISNGKELTSEEIKEIGCVIKKKLIAPTIKIN